MFQSKQKNQKIDKILFTEPLSKFHYPYQNWYGPLKRYCNKMLSFNIKWNNLVYGKDLMNKKFLEFIQKEKPDYIFLWVTADELYFDTLLNIRKISPKTQIVMVLQDDDSEFEDYTRFFILFSDYGLVFHKRFMPRYNKEGFKDVFYSAGINTKFFKPMNLEKKYDVVFIGFPKSDLSGRYEYLKFLKDNNVNLKLFGWGWDKYPEFKDVYGGVLDSEEMVKILNQTKIYLNLSRNSYGKPTDIKAKIFEGGACNTFVLTEYCEDYLDLFKKGKEMIFFDTQKDLLNKIKYYLKNEKQREKISYAAHKKTVKVYGLDVELKNFFDYINKTNKELKHKPLPKVSKKIIQLSKKDLNLSLEILKSKLKDYDYIYFKKGKVQDLKYRKYLQSYSLEKSKKPISCCNYYVHSKILGDYLYFRSKFSIKISRREYNSCLDINQLMITKDYFFKNLEKFKGFINKNKEIDILEEKNTVFVSFPLIRLNKLKTTNKDTIEKMFDLKFLYNLYALKYQKKFLSGALYLSILLLKSFKGEKFILYSIISSLKDRETQRKLSALNP